MTERGLEKIIGEIEATPTHAGCTFGEVGEPDDQEVVSDILDGYDLEYEIGPTYGTNPNEKNGTPPVTVYDAEWPFYPDED